MRFDLQPFLTGSLVELRPLRPGDDYDLIAVAADPAIWEQHPDMMEDAFRYVDRVVFVVAPDTVRSQRAVEKIGGIRAGWRRQDGHEDSVYVIAAPGDHPPRLRQEVVA